MLSLDQVARFESEGYVTLDTSLSPAELDAAEEAFDRLLSASKKNSDRGAFQQEEVDGDLNKDPANLADEGSDQYLCFNSNTSRPCYEDVDFLATIAHPFFEDVAKQVLRTDEVEYIECFPLDRPPTPRPASGAWPDSREVWAKNCHVDVQLTRSDFEASPRRDQLMMWLWLSEVTPESGAMRIMPKSHARFMTFWEETLLPERRQWLPRVHGLNPVGGGAAMPSQPEGLPQPIDSSAGPLSWIDREPIAATAHRGQMLLHCGAMLHSAWYNQSNESRKGYLLQWIPKAVAGGLEASRIEKCRSLYPKLRAALPEGRRHLIPQKCRHFVTGYEDKWPEMFMEMGARM